MFDLKGQKLVRDAPVKDIALQMCFMLQHSCMVLILLLVLMLMLMLMLILMQQSMSECTHVFWKCRRHFYSYQDKMQISAD